MHFLHSLVVKSSRNVTVANELDSCFSPSMSNYTANTFDKMRLIKFCLLSSWFISVVTISSLIIFKSCYSYGANLLKSSSSYSLGKTPGSVVIHLKCDQNIIATWYWKTAKCMYALMSPSCSHSHMPILINPS